MSKSIMQDERLDRRLKQIKPDALPWTERYEGWEDPGIKS